MKVLLKSLLSILPFFAIVQPFHLITKSQSSLTSRSLLLDHYSNDARRAYNQQQRRDRKQPLCLLVSQKQKTTAHRKTFLKAAAEMSGKTEDRTKRSIFYDYNKPVVLIGCSSDASSQGAGELPRLGQSIARTLGGRVTTVSSCDDFRSLLKATQDGSLKWPHVIVLDWAETLRSDNSSSVQDDFKRVAQGLYESSGLLSIFVNVKPSTRPTPETYEMHRRFEDSVFVPYSDYELCVKNEGVHQDDFDDYEWQHIEWELVRLIARARLVPAIPGDTSRSANTAHLLMGQHTFFLSLSFPDVQQVEPFMSDMCQDVDALEYRADLLKCRDDRFDLIYGMQLLRRYARPHMVRVPALASLGAIVLEDVMPIVYTVRTENQAGSYPDDTKTGIPRMFDMLEWGLRGGVEVLDVESAWDPVRTDRLLTMAETRYSSQILGSHHVVSKEVSLEEAVFLFQQCELRGRAHGAKVVLSITDEEKDRMAYQAAMIASELASKDNQPVIPKISLILGDIGQFSRVINLPFTPVTHESLPMKAAPGQMSASEIMTTRLLTKVLLPKKYAILGHQISYSVSPQMHGAAFAATKLPHEYIRVDLPTVEEFVETPFFESDDFGGTSVTIPHKQAIMPFLDHLSEPAKIIGSVNTVIVKREYQNDDFKKVLYGDNTDWQGIYNPLKRLLGSNGDGMSDGAVILGAGGTGRAAAYVAQLLGLKLLFYNRTPSKAQELCDNFGGVLLSSLDQDGDRRSLGNVLKNTMDGKIKVVISTLPAGANFVLPTWTLDRSVQSELPIVFDVNYKPFNTALLLQAVDAGCKVVRGSEMLWEQGVGQFELFTGRSAPYSVMKQVVLENCKEPQEKNELAEKEVAK